MSESKATPGPWRVGDHKPYVEVWGRMQINTYPIIASMECEPREANARLIAAAPDLLEAILKSDDAHWTPAMRAAIAKATGATS